MRRPPAWGGRPLTLHEVLQEEDLYFRRMPPPDKTEWGFTPNEIRDSEKLLERLRPGSSDTLPFVVWLRAQGVIQAAAASGAVDDELRSAFADAFNVILSCGRSIYDHDRFVGLSLPPEVAGLAGLAPTGPDLVYLNRCLLETPFGVEVKPVDESHLAALWDRLAREAPGRSALCLSGGGIRSATFSLGVLQGLARAGLLGSFEYLSTVSGGGYIGSWLTAWIKRETLPEVLRQLSDPVGSRIEPEQGSIRHLRDYTNYLTPSPGTLSADTWTILATYLRNTLLNWAVFLPVLVLLVLVPRIAVLIVRPAGEQPSRSLVLWLVGAAAVYGAVAVAYVHSTRPSLVAESKNATAFVLQHRDRRAFIQLCLAPILAAAFFLTAAFGHLSAGGRPIETLRGWAPGFLKDEQAWVILAALGAAIHLTGWIVSLLLLRRTPANQVTSNLVAKWVGAGPSRLIAGGLELVAVALTGAVPGYLAYLLLGALGTPDAHPLRVLAYTAIGPSVMLTLMLLAGILFTGLSSRVLDDADREWGARFGGMTLSAALVWGVWSALVIYGPVALVSGRKIAGAVASIGGVSGLLSVLGGKSPLTRPVGSADDRKKGARRRASPLPLLAGIFIAVLIVITSFGVNQLALLWSSTVGDPGSLLGGWDPAGWRDGLAASRPDLVQLAIVRYLPPLDLLKATTTGMVVVVGGLLLLLAGATWLIDVNQFSLHAMYRARLIRAYLGASRKPAERSPNPFTGFDDKDNLGMRTLVEDVPAGPVKLFHVINVTLNLVQSERLSWQDRKAASFTISPLHAGSWSVAYRPIGGTTLTKRYGGDNGISLGTAAAISGAAASPNMGYHSSPLVTLLMTLFNARLGWWLGNPGIAGNKTWNTPRATGGAVRILNEALGKTSARRKFIYLSDGGHFDNLGLYEMLLRRCRFIMAVDASADPDFAFADLGMALRNIRIDLGIPIEFATMPIRKRGGSVGTYWAIGIIRYDRLSPGARPGVLVYIKPTLYDRDPREPEDVRAYAASSPLFPHEPTTDQWFSESQFESYRSLGAYISQQTVEELKAHIRTVNQKGTAEDWAELAALIAFTGTGVPAGGAP